MLSRTVVFQYTIDLICAFVLVLALLVCMREFFCVRINAAQTTIVNLKWKRFSRCMCIVFFGAFFAVLITEYYPVIQDIPQLLKSKNDYVTSEIDREVDMVNMIPYVFFWILLIDVIYTVYAIRHFKKAKKCKGLFDAFLIISSVILLIGNILAIAVVGGIYNSHISDAWSVLSISFIILLCVICGIRFNSKRTDKIFEKRPDYRQMAERNNRCVRRMEHTIKFNDMEYGKSYSKKGALNALDEASSIVCPTNMNRREEAKLIIEMQSKVKEIEGLGIIFTDNSIIIFNENKVYWVHYDEIVKVVLGKRTKTPLYPVLFALADGSEFVVRCSISVRRDKYDELIIHLRKINSNIQIIEEM